MMQFPIINPWGVSYGDPSNLRNGSNPSYAIDDFLTFYPQFGSDSSGNLIVPTTVIQTFIDMANGSLNYRRYYSQWTHAMGLFVAHHCTLWVRRNADPSNGAQAVADAGNAQGVVTSQSVGDVSESVDVNVTARDQWAMWNATDYGRELATMARAAGLGGMYAW